MSEEAEIPWWEEAKQESLERRKVKEAKNAPAKPGDSFLIVTEGTVTEPTYFELLRQSLQLSMVQVKVVPGEASDPRHVVRSAAQEVKSLAKRAKKKCTSNFEVEKYDHVWAVIDTDVAVRKNFWNDVVQLAESKGVSLAHSTPCFEYWLLLHFEYTTKATLTNGTKAKSEVKKHFGKDYSTNENSARAILPKALPYWQTAVEHAKRARNHHKQAGTPIPANPSTDVDLLVEMLGLSVPPALR